MSADHLSWPASHLSIRGLSPDFTATLLNGYQQASTGDCLSCRVRVDALPQAASVQELALMGKDAGSQELLPAGATLETGKTPNLYQLGVPSSK